MTPEVLELGAEPTERETPDLRRRRRTVAVLAVLAVAVAAAAAIVNALNQPTAFPGVYVAPEAVTTTPTRAWTWTGPDTVQQVTAGAADTYVITSDDHLTSLDRDGHRRWTISLPEAEYVTAPEHGDVVLVSTFGGDPRKTYVVSAGSGRRLWTADATPMTTGDDFLILEDDHSVWRADIATGKRRWRAAAGSEVAASAGHVVLRRDDHLVDLSTTDGKEVWSTRLESPPSGDDELEVVIADGYAVVADDDGAEALSLDTGKVLWTTESGGDTTNIGLTTSDEVFVVAETAGESAHQTVGIYDDSGRVTHFGSLADNFWAEPFIAGNHHYLYDIFSGAVYDAATYKIVDRSNRADSAQLRTLADVGYYALTSGAVKFYRYADHTAAWRLTGDFSDETSTLTAGDGQLLVSDGSTLSAYR